MTVTLDQKDCKWQWKQMVFSLICLRIQYHLLSAEVRVQCHCRGQNCVPQIVDKKCLDQPVH